MTIQQTQADPRALILRYRTFLNGLIWLTVAVSSLTFLEPSPYDFLLLLLCATWFFSGFRVHRAIVPAALFYFLHILAGYFALVPYFSDVDSATYYYYSIYMLIALIVFSILFSEDTDRRTDMLLQGYVMAAFAASIFAIIGYFDIWGTAEKFAPAGRAMGPFKDPNVYGSFIIPAHLYLLRRLLAGASKSFGGALLAVAQLLTILLGLLLTFSRGSWAATIFATVMMVAMMFATTRSGGERRRILLVFWIMVGLAGAGLAVALSSEQISDMFTKRSTVAQDYDSGETGRFGNQRRSIPMLVDLPNGMGPLVFRKYFGIEPHNSYVSAFANFGWLGGFAFILWVGSSCFVGFRLCATDSPYQGKAQVLFPPVFVYFLQALQIDIDHWRFVYLVLGALWGLEAARQKWAARQAPRRALAAIASR